MAKNMVEDKKVVVEASKEFSFSEDGHNIIYKEKGSKFGIYKTFADRLVENKQVKIIDSDVEYDIEGNEIKGAVTDEGNTES